MFHPCQGGADLLGRGGTEAAPLGGGDRDGRGVRTTDGRHMEIVLQRSLIDRGPAPPSPLRNRDIQIESRVKVELSSLPRNHGI